jgi:hypothetical protein
MGRIFLVLTTLALACGHRAASRSDAESGHQPLAWEEILDGMQRALPRMRACPLDPPGSPPPRVRVTVAENGRVLEVRTVDLTSGTPAASCRERAIKLVVFRANPGITFDYVFPLD